VPLISSPFAVWRRVPSAPPRMQGLGDLVTAGAGRVALANRIAVTADGDGRLRKPKVGVLGVGQAP